MRRSRPETLKRQIKTLVKDLYYLPLDIIDSLSGKRDEYTPPRRLIFVGNGDFRKQGDEFLKYFIELGGLKPTHRILDVGCGIGRMAIPLTKFLTTGSYEGFDIIPRGIKWTNKQISSKYPNFHFQLADVYNEWYNPGGKCDADQYKFPFANESFDFVFLTSVFTHMLPTDMNNYFSEIVRVLRPKGKSLITYFLINNQSRALITQKRSKFDFVHRDEGYWTISLAKPESAIAYDEEHIRNDYRTSKMTIIDPIQYGSWSGREKSLSFQDIIVAEKN